MKKVIALVISALLITTLLASCASKSLGTAQADYGSAHIAVAPSAAAAPAAGQGSSGAAKPTANAELGGSNLSSADKNGALTSGSLTASISGDKIIYNYNAQIETTKFEDTIKNLEMLLNRFGAFVETSYMSGSSYGYTKYRSADYTVRVPVQNFKSMTGSLTSLGNVYDEKTTSKNITAQFIDTQSRLKAFKTEEDRLLAMLGKASTVQEMITIESRLSDIRYQIESLTSTLQNWQNQVDFSTVTLHLKEVATLTEQKPVQRTYWEKIGDGLSSTFKGLGDFFKDFFMVLIIILPVLLVLGVIAVVIILIVRASRKKKRAKMSRMAPPQQTGLNQFTQNTQYYQQHQPNQQNQPSQQNPNNQDNPPNQNNGK